MDIFSYLYKGSRSSVWQAGLPILMFTWVVIGCSISTQKHPSKFPDFVQAENQIDYVNYKVGEWYELRKPMFLVTLTSGEPSIVVPGHSSPTLELYFADDGRREYHINRYQINRYLPKGTRIRLMSIKYVNEGIPIPFFYIDEDNQWVNALFRECIAVEGRISGPIAKARLEDKQIGSKVKFVWDYDREYFRKIK